MNKTAQRKQTKQKFVCINISIYYRPWSTHTNSPHWWPLMLL